MHAGMRSRLVIGWIVGVVGSGLGLVASYYFDMPTGPAIVVILGLFLATAWVVDAVRSEPEGNPQP